MSGHSKWHNIQAKKGKTDAARGKIFTKIGREIAIAVREGGGADPATNGKLRDVIAKAKANNMPNDNIKRSIAKAAGEGSGVSYKEVTYEGYADGGVAVAAVYKGTAAEKAGLKTGDVITKVGDKAITSAQDVTTAVRSHKPSFFFKFCEKSAGCCLGYFKIFRCFMYAHLLLFCKLFHQQFFFGIVLQSSSSFL